MSAERTFATSRNVPYPPHVVYQAFAAPELLAAWWGPEGFSNTFQAFEFAPRGRWVFTMHGPDGKNYPNTNIFVELEAGKKVVIRHDCEPYFSLTVSLFKQAGGTLIRWEQVFDDMQIARAVRPIVVPANEQNLDRLLRTLAHPGKSS